MAPKLSGYFDGPFWNRLLLQLGQSEPAINHAIMAVSSMYERFESNAGKDPLLPAEEDRFALTSYNKAIKSLSERLSNDTQSVHVPLVACVLFICLEFLRRDIDAAMTHMHSGFAILRARSTRLSRNRVRSTSDERGIEETMLSIFARLRILSGLFGRPAPPMQVYEGPIEEVSCSQLSISNFGEARSTLIARMAPCLVYVRICSEARYDSFLSSEYSIKQASLQATLTQWRISFEDWFTKRTQNSKEDHLAANLLRLHHGTTEIWLATCLQPNETAFDDYTDQFKKLVNLASSLINAPQAIPGEPDSHFSFEMGTIPPLYFMAVKCRHPAVRRRAIGLLLASPRREGLWDAYRAGRVAERVMLREEIGLEPNSGYRSDVVHAHYTNEFPRLSPQGESVTTSRVVPLFESPMDPETKSARELKRMIAKEYRAPSAYSSSNTESQEDETLRPLHPTTTSLEHACTHVPHQNSNFNAVGMAGGSANEHWRLNPADAQPSPLHTEVHDTNKSFTSTDSGSFPFPWDQRGKRASPRAFPQSEPGPQPWPKEEFRIHGLTYPERDFMEFYHLDKPSLWTGETPCSHPTHDSNLLESYLEMESPMSSSHPSFESRRVICDYPEPPDPDAFPPTEDRMPGEKQRIHDIMPTKMPGELQRIHDARVANEVAAPFKQTIQPVTFRWKPYGLDGDWQVWEETIRL